MTQKLTKAFWIFLIVMLTLRISGFSQIDSVKYPVFDFEIETGVFFNQNEYFFKKYNSKSNFNWTIGTTFGNSTWKILPWVKYSQYQLNKDSLSWYNTTIPLKAKRNQFSIGLVNPIRISQRNFLQLKYGVSYNLLSESSTDLYSETIGFLFSAGFMRQFTKVFNYHIDVGYEYSKASEGDLYRDWSGFYINMGISFNIISDF